MGSSAGADWSAARDGVLRRLRAEGRCWQEIGTILGVSPEIARERGRRIGAPAPGLRPRIRPDDPHRPPLPAGHPRSWGLLTSGTLLDGAGWSAGVPANAGPAGRR
jgi:hypothetical protein